MTVRTKSGSDWRIDFAAIAGILLVGSLLYAHTLHVPWYLDDIRAIVENSAIHNISDALGNLFSSPRGIADLTFALNYHFGGIEVVGYHLVNIGIHLIASSLVFLLLKRVFPDRLLLAFGGALIFVAHPLQTQAVTYIVQRMTSLAALFFFLAIYMYIRFRESSANSRLPGLMYGGALICGALAVLVKQNTAVLPLAILLFDRFFLADEERPAWRRHAMYAAPFAVVPAMLGIKSLLLPLLAGHGAGLAEVSGLPDLVHLRHSSPLNYLVTEFSVLWIYLRLLFIPYGQALDYDYPIVATIWSLKSLTAFLGVALLFSAATYLRKKLPLVSAGILWFFLCLAVESTIIPLDPIFEHRLYLPMFGFALVLMAGLARLPRQTALSGGIVLILVLSILTWQRNDLWNHPLAFHKDNLLRAPRSERVHVDLAKAFQKSGDLEEAEKFYLRAMQINPDYVLSHINLSMVYATQGQKRKAMDILLEGLRRDPDHFKLYINLGVLYNASGRFEEAVNYLRRGLALKPDYADLHFHLALGLERLGQLDEAISHYRKAIELADAAPDVHFNLGMALYKKGLRKEALQSFLRSSRLDPGHARALFNTGILYLELGNLTGAQSALSSLRRIDPVMAKKLQSDIDARFPSFN